MSDSAVTPRRLPSTLLSVGLILLVLLIAGGIGIVLVDRQIILDKSHSANLITARLLSKRMEGIVRVADTIMLHSARTIAKGEGLEETLDEARGLLSDALELSFMLVMDVDGNVVANTADTQPSGLNNADRDYFKSLKAGAEFVVGAPITSLSTGNTVIPLSRARHNADGSFAGVLLVAVETRVIDEFLQAATPDPGTACALFSSDGTLLARDPPLNIGKGLQRDCLWRQ